MKNLWTHLLFLRSCLTQGLVNEFFERNLKDIDGLNFQFTPETLFFGKRSELPKVQQSSNLFCTKAINRLKAGPEIIQKVLAGGNLYTDETFTGQDMVYWDGDTITTPDYTNVANYINSKAYWFGHWTQFLPSDTDLFYSNGTISFKDIKQGSLGDCYWIATISALAEWPHLLKNVFLTQIKNSAGIFGIQLYLRGKPYHISLDYSIMFLDYLSESKPVYAQTSSDKKVVWGLVLEKAWAKVIGNYMKIEGGYTHASIRALTGIPTFYYTTKTNFDVDTVFKLLFDAELANYIMTAGTDSGSDKTFNTCGLANGHAYTLLSAFYMFDSSVQYPENTIMLKMIMIRNPWGRDQYNQIWNGKSSKWVTKNIAQVPLGINPTLSQQNDGIIIMPVSLMPTCLNDYQIGHQRDKIGWVRTWFDLEKAFDGTSTFTLAPYEVRNTVYISVENYPLNLVPAACVSNRISAIVTLSVVHNNYPYSKTWYDIEPYWISIPYTQQSASSPYTITVTYQWFGSPANEYTVSVYSLFDDVPILDSNGNKNQYYMDGRSPSGFTSSKYCGLTCIPADTQTPVIQEPQKVMVKSLYDVFAKATDIGYFFLLIWYNPWVLFIWFHLW